MTEMGRLDEQERAFGDFVRLCEQTCEHDCGMSEERLILEYLERIHGVGSNRYEWRTLDGLEDKQ